MSGPVSKNQSISKRTLNGKLLFLQVVSESLAMITKCLITVVLVFSAPQWGLYIFSAAQVRVYMYNKGESNIEILFVI